MTSPKRLAATGSGAPTITYIEDVFSTWLYTGNSSTQTITNGIDLSGKGGMVWIKQRTANAVSASHQLTDTVRGARATIFSNSTSAQDTNATYRLTAFNSNGFSVDDNGAFGTNVSGETYVSWTFREQAKFFDVVTYTGNGSNGRVISHLLGSTPGCIIIKRTDSTGNWVTWHRVLPDPVDGVLYLNSTNAQMLQGWFSSIGSTSFTISSNAEINASGGTYVAYLFAHNAGGFGESGNDNVISCGSYLGSNHRAQEVVQLGYEPQWVLIKNVTTLQNWVLVDNMRNMSSSGGNAWLAPNTTGVETTSASDRVVATSTGFYFDGPQAPINQAGSTFIYIAIRRGPMKTPTSGTSVFAPVLRAGTRSANTQVAVGFSPDLVMGRYRNNAALHVTFTDKVRGTAVQFNSANTTQTTATNAITGWTPNGYVCGDDSNIGNYNYYFDSNIHIAWCLRRAPGFFDIVTATTSSSGTTHSLGVKPEFAIHMGNGQAWFVLSLPNGRGVLSSNLAFTPVGSGSGIDYYLNPTSTVINPQNLYGNGVLLTSYLFATLPGISKVGTYVGTNATLTIDCGFTNGARFILIKRTDASGDLTSSWWILDTARGIINGNDPGLAFDRSAGDVTNQDFAVIVSSGFQLPGGINALTNVSGGQYLYLAIA